MDELSAFKGAPPALLENERRLFERARVVFTGGVSLHEAKRRQHPRVHAFPSSVEVGHFRQAREPLAEPPDQATIAKPRLGHHAVLDELLDTGLLAGIADERPDWQLILVGPVVSTPIKGVVRTYGERGLVRIASTPAEFVAALEATPDDGWDRRAWLAEVDVLLAQMSWDTTWNRMKELLA
jgi:hypothetical protein